MNNQQQFQNNFNNNWQESPDRKVQKRISSRQNSRNTSVFSNPAHCQNNTAKYQQQSDFTCTQLSSPGDNLVTTNVFGSSFGGQNGTTVFGNFKSPQQPHNVNMSFNNNTSDKKNAEYQFTGTFDNVSNRKSPQRIIDDKICQSFEQHSQSKQSAKKKQQQQIQEDVDLEKYLKNRYNPSSNLYNKLKNNNSQEINLKSSAVFAPTTQSNMQKSQSDNYHQEKTQQTILKTQSSKERNNNLNNYSKEEFNDQQTSQSNKSYNNDNNPNNLSFQNTQQTMQKFQNNKNNDKENYFEETYLQKKQSMLSGESQKMWKEQYGRKLNQSHNDNDVEGEGTEQEKQEEEEEEYDPFNSEKKKQKYILYESKEKINGQNNNRTRLFVPSLKAFESEGTLLEEILAQEKAKKQHSNSQYFGQSSYKKKNGQEEQEEEVGAENEFKSEDIKQNYQNGGIGNTFSNINTRSTLSHPLQKQGSQNSNYEMHKLSNNMNEDLEKTKQKINLNQKTQSLPQVQATNPQNYFKSPHTAVSQIPKTPENIFNLANTIQFNKDIFQNESESPKTKDQKISVLESYHGNSKSQNDQNQQTVRSTENTRLKVNSQIMQPITDQDMFMLKSSEKSMRKQQRLEQTLQQKYMQQMEKIEMGKIQDPKSLLEKQQQQLIQMQIQQHHQNSESPIRIDDSEFYAKPNYTKCKAGSNMDRSLSSASLSQMKKNKSLQITKEIAEVLPVAKVEIDQEFYKQKFEGILKEKFQNRLKVNNFIQNTYSQMRSPDNMKNLGQKLTNDTQIRGIQTPNSHQEFKTQYFNNQSGHQQSIHQLNLQNPSQSIRKSQSQSNNKLSIIQSPYNLLSTLSSDFPQQKSCGKGSIINQVKSDILKEREDKIREQQQLNSEILRRLESTNQRDIHKMYSIIEKHMKCCKDFRADLKYELL